MCLLKYRLKRKQTKKLGRALALAEKRENRSEKCKGGTEDRKIIQNMLVNTNCHCGVLLVGLFVCWGGGLVSFVGFYILKYEFQRHLTVNFYCK